MSKSKKIIGIVLAVIMAFSCMSVAFAVTETNAPALTIESADAQVTSGNSTTVTVKLAADFYVAAVSVPVFYETAGVEVSALTAAQGFQIDSKTTVNNKEALLKSAGLPTDGSWDFVLISYVPESGTTLAKYAVATEIAHFTVKNNGAAKDMVFATKENTLKTKDNSTGRLYVGSSTDALLVKAENVENNTGLVATCTIKSAAVAAEPKLVGLDTGVVDNERGYIYGVPAGTTDFSKYFKVENGFFEIKPVGENTAYGTGSVLTVYATGDTEKTTPKGTYTFILFGDNDGNGTITGNDSVAIMQYVADSVVNSLTPEQFFASDIDFNNSVTGNDSVGIMQYVADSAANPTPIAPVA